MGNGGLVQGRNHEPDAMTPAITSEDAFIALRTFLLDIVPVGTEIVQGLDNRVPMPGVDGWVVMTETRLQKMAQTTHDYSPDAGQKTVARSTALHYQLDVYGEAAADTAQVITTLLADAHGVDALKPSGIAPLYCEDPLQMPLLAGEQQYIKRMMVRCALHGIIVVTVDQQFADNLITTLTEFH